MIVAAIPPNMASNSNGSIPRIVVPDAIATGTMRVVVALITASRGAFPAAVSVSIWSTRTMAFLMFIPINPNKPRMAKKSNVLPNSNSPSTMPIKISGSISKMTMGLR